MGILDKWMPLHPTNTSIMEMMMIKLRKEFANWVTRNFLKSIWGKCKGLGFLFFLVFKDFKDIGWMVITVT